MENTVKYPDVKANTLALFAEAKAKGLSIRKAAKMAGIGYATVHRWKNGTQMPYALLLDAFARVIREHKGGK